MDWTKKRGQRTPLPRNVVHELLKVYFDFRSSDYVIGDFSSVLGKVIRQDDLDVVMNNFNKGDRLQTKALYLLRWTQYKVEKKHFKELLKFVNSPLRFYMLYWEVLAKHCSSKSEARYLLDQLGEVKGDTKSEMAEPIFHYLNKYIYEQDIEMVLECLNGRNPHRACPALAYVFGRLDDEQKLKTLKSFMEPPYKIPAKYKFNTTYNFGDEVFKLLSTNFSYKHNRYIIDSIVHKDNIAQFMVYWPLINPGSLVTKDIECLEQFLEYSIPIIRDLSCKILKELHSFGMY